MFTVDTRWRPESRSFQNKDFDKEESADKLFMIDRPLEAIRKTAYFMKFKHDKAAIQAHKEARERM